MSENLRDYVKAIWFQTCKLVTLYVAAIYFTFFDI